MLSVYLDESGTHRNSNVCVIGALVATPQKWERLTSSWQKILDEVGISDFHSSDCANGGGIFKGWKEKEDREKLYARFVNLTVRAAAYRVWTAVVMDDYRLYFNDIKEKFPYSLCALGCASRLKWIASQRGESFTLPYVFDQGEKGRQTYSQIDRMLRRGQGAFYGIGALTKGERVKMLPLQAADLHAYEVYRFFSDQLQSGRSSRRGHFRELLKIPDGGGYLLAGEKLGVLVKEVVRQKLAGVIGPVIDNITVDRLDRERGIKLRRVEGSQNG